MSQVIQVFSEIDQGLKGDLSIIDGVDAVYQFHITDEDPRVYHLILKGVVSYTSAVKKEDRYCSLQLAANDFAKLAKGKLNGTQAFMSGKLKIKGNMGLALKLQSILGAFNKSR